MKSIQTQRLREIPARFQLVQPSPIVLLHVTATRDVILYIDSIMPGFGVLLRFEFCVNGFIRSSKIIHQCIIQTKLFVFEMAVSSYLGSNRILKRLKIPARSSYHLLWIQLEKNWLPLSTRAKKSHIGTWDNKLFLNIFEQHFVIFTSRNYFHNKI